MAPDGQLAEALHEPLDRLGVCPIEPVEDAHDLGLAELVGEHAGEPGPISELVLEAEVTEQRLVEVLTLFERRLDRRRGPTDGHAERVRDAAEAADGVGQELRPVGALAGVLFEVALDAGRRCLGTARRGDHLLGLGQPEEAVQLREEEVGS